MSRSRKIRLEEDVAPNLIPMVDIMFLLLLFFMLEADMGQRDLEDVALPVANAIKEDKDAKGKGSDRLTINIFHRYSNEVACPTHHAGQLCREDRHWRIGIRGSDYSDPEQLMACLVKEADRFKDASLDPKSSERRVMIRADGSAAYGHIQDVMEACARVGIYQIECGAAKPPQ